MLGAMIALAAVLFAVIPLVFAALAILGTVFSGAAVLLAAGVYAGKGILIGIVLGFAAYRALRKARTAERAD